MKDKTILEDFKKIYPEKFPSPEAIFSRIHAGDRIFIGTGCGEPQYLVHELVDYVNKNPKAFFDAELIHIWTLGVAPYTDEKFQDNFRLDSFFVGDSTRGSVNRGQQITLPSSSHPFPIYSARRWFQWISPWSRPPFLTSTAI